MDVLDRILDGAVDLHVHSGPSPMPRRIDHVEAAQSADSAGFRAIVVKCHYHNTVMDVLAMQPRLEGVGTQVFGGIALNSQVGGINPHAVDLSLKMGGKIIWFPTISSHAHLCHAAEDETIQAHFQPLGIRQSDEVDIFGEDGDLIPEVHEVLALAKEHDAIVSAGHMGPERATALMEAAAALGHTKLMINHPNFVMEAEKAQVSRFAELGATIEHSLVMYLTDEKYFPLQSLLDWIDLVGPERTSLGSDLGQVGNPMPLEAYREVCSRLLDSGISEDDLRLMVTTNPASLLGLEV